MRWSAQVAAAAMSFMAPRTLEALSMPQMAAWGLRGLTALDPRLTVEHSAEGRDAGTLSIRFDAAGAGRVLLKRPAPADDDSAGWGEAVAQIAQAGWEVSDQIRHAGTQGIIRSFFDELFNHMDPYSRYAPPGEAELDRVRRNGRAGVGITTVLRGGSFVVTALQAGGSAAQAGVRIGDRIQAVDGQSVQGADPGSVEALLAGPENTAVELTLRGRDGRSRTVLLDRLRVPPETVVARRNNDILVLAITGFSRSTGSRLAQELIRGVADPRPHGVVLDLRGNRGGVLQQAVASAAMLQGVGVVAVTTGRAPEANHVFLADGRDLADDLPVVVLVDGNSASAAEILAASLADQRRAVVIGSATLGKGLVQTITSLPNGGELLVSWSRVLAPLGWPIQGLGVLPQVCTSLGTEALARQLAALGHGIQTMQPALIRHHQARAPLPPAEILEIRAACPAIATPMPPAPAAGQGGGRDADFDAARHLIETPDAYATALLSVPPVEPQNPALPSQGLTPDHRVRN